MEYEGTVRLSRFGIRIPLFLWTIVVIYPIIWMFLGSFKSNAEIYRNPWGLPTSFSLDNFIQAWNNYNIGISVFNSLVVTLVGAALTLVLARSEEHTSELQSRGH